MASNKKVILVDVFFLASLWIAGILFVNPLGEFPLNDDWSFSLTAHNFALTGNYQPVGWAAMPLITNVLWGGLFEKLFGDSFFSLRLSTLVVGILGVVGTYLMALELGLSRKIRLLVALLLLTNPVYFSLSYTYMTDVPFAALTILSCLVFIKHLKTLSNWSYILGIVLAVFAVLSRQLALSIPLVFMLAFLLANGISKKNIAKSLIPLIVVTSSLMLYQHWLSITGRLPALYYQKNSHLMEVLLDPKSVVLNLAFNGFKAITYFGAFLSPFVFLYLSKNYLRKKNKPTLLVALVGLFGILLAYKSLGVTLSMPVGGNVLDSIGIGPLTLMDTFVLHQIDVSPLPKQFWLLFTMVSFLGGAIIITESLLAAQRLSISKIYGGLTFEESSIFFLLAVAVIQITPLLLAGLFDRYLIPILPLVAIAMAALLDKNSKPGIVNNALSISFIVVLGVYSILGTKDYLEWNRVRWQAISMLESDYHATPNDIDGGFEFNGYYLYNPDYKIKAGKSWWWVNNDQYIVSFGFVPGYGVLKEYQFKRWLPPGRFNLYVLRKGP